MRFRQITIVGLGLIGGSLGMAIRRRRLAATVVGLSRTAAAVRRARRQGAIDFGTTDEERAVRDADLVVLATPVDAIVPSGRRLARLMPLGSILTDVGSTKAALVRALERSVPPRVAVVGGHPLAGSEQRGLRAARADLFDGAVCILTPTARTNSSALRRVSRLWSHLVRRVVTMSPAAHDRLLAKMSHLPHLVAACLSGITRPAPGSIAPPSFLEMTRIAKSDPDLWDNIFLSNRDAVLAATGVFDRRWRTLQAAVARRDRVALRRLLAQAKARRDALD